MKNPNLIPKPFAQNGQKDAIPTNHKSDLPSQKATWDTGFPQITMMPVTAGGLPPSGRDFNGILNQISDNIVYLSQGGKFKYSQEYADSTGGYPKGAILQSDDETREFQSLVDNNKINFNKESSEKVSAVWKQVSTTQLLDELNKKLNRSDVVQSVGTGKTQVMSQNAVTDALSTKQDKGDYATNSALNQVNANANSRLEKAKDGADIPNKPEFVKNLNFIEQQTGASTTTVMSQQAVTNAIAHATPDASTTQKGLVQLTSSRVSSSETLAATANAVAQNYNDIRALQEKTSDASTTQRGLVQLSDSRTLFSSSVAATSLAASQNYMDMRGMLGNIGKTGRELGVTYESKQGFAVFVHVDGISSTGSNFLSAVVNGVNFRGSMCAPLANQRISISFMIPAGATYSVWQHSGVVTDLVWVETDKR